MPQVFPENLGLPMRPGTHRGRQTWDCAQPIRALLALLLALHASCCACQPLCVWSLACCSLRLGQSSASPMASGSPSAVSHRVSCNSVSEVNFSLCPLLSIHYLATLHALQLLHLSPRPRRTQMQPNRGPKSAPEPFYERPAPLATHRLRGVRVSPLSAGGEGLCKARSRLLKRPGKLAEGIRQQLGSLSCHVSTGSGHHHHTLSRRHVPWGKRFRLWRFRYKIVRKAVPQVAHGYCL